MTQALHVSTNRCRLLVVAPSSPPFRRSKNMVPHTVIFEGEAFSILGQFIQPDGTRIDKADIAEIQIIVKNPSDGSFSRIYPDKTTAWTDTPATGALWPLDSDGYDLTYLVDQDAYMPLGGQTLRYEVTVRLDATGALMRAACTVSAIAMED